MGTGAAADPRELDALASGTCANPFHVLGRHATVEAGLPALVVRTIQPRASSVELVANGNIEATIDQAPEKQGFAAVEFYTQVKTVYIGG